MKPTKKANYWTNDTEKQLRLYLLEKDNNKKNAIYTEHLHKPFNKLIENVVYSYKLYNFEHTGLEDIKQMCIVHILKNIHKFDPNSETKAYSYFGTTIKNLLLQLQKKYNIKQNTHISIEQDMSDAYGNNDSYYNKSKDNNVLNSINYSYCIDTEDLTKDMFFSFIEQLKREVELLAIIAENKEWVKFLESFILIIETNRGISVVENKFVFYGALKKLNSISQTKNYKFIKELKLKYFKFKEDFINGKKKEAIDAYL